MSMKSIFNSFFIDLMSMKSKSAILWILIIAVMSVVNMKSISFIFLVTLVSLLFMNDEKGVYATNFAPVNKKSAVYGRYLFALMSFAFCLVVNLLADLIAPYFYAEYITSGIYFYSLMFVLFIVLISIEMPLLYWQGYSKARIFQYVIFVAMLLIIVKGIGEGNIYVFISGLSLNVPLLLPILAATIVLLIASLCISVKIYSKKDI